MIANSAESSGFAFDDLEKAAIGKLITAVRELGGDAEFSDNDCSHFYSSDYEFDEDEDHVTLAGTWVSLIAGDRGRAVYRLEIHTAELGDEFEIREFAEFNSAVADLCEELELDGFQLPG